MDVIDDPKTIKGYKLYGWMSDSSSDSKDLIGIYDTYEEAQITSSTHRKTIHFLIQPFYSDYIDMDDIDDVSTAIEFILMGKDKKYQRRVLSLVMNSFKDG